MSSTQEIKRRIKAVTNTSQITRAMEMVSATKMRKSQEVALRSRPYAIEALRILAEMTHRTEYKPALMHDRLVKTTAVVVVASDRGLAGAFNSNVFRAFEIKLNHVLNGEGKYTFIAVGRKAEEYLGRKGVHIEHSYKDFGDYIEMDETKPLSELLIRGFLEQQWDKVVVVSTHFRTTLKQDVVVREVLPVHARKVRDTVRELVPQYGRFSEISHGLPGTGVQRGFKEDFEYLIEPDPQTVLDALAPELVKIAIHDLVLEANASEHSARMVAMKNASENAGELKDELNLEYNKSRQAGITREISEIVAGAEALQM